MPEDKDLLKAYCETNSEEAFAEIVARHLDLVYSVANRQMAFDSHAAEDVCQEVFSSLAREAKKLGDEIVLGAWLCWKTRNTAIDVVRRESRRRDRERKAHEMKEADDEAGKELDWERARPLLDEAISELKEEDRDAVWLRYFENRSFAMIGRQLQLSENAARMRVSRALDKLNRLVSTRGITSSATALAAAIGGQAGIGAPGGLAGALASGAISGVATVAWGSWVLSFITIMNTSKIITLSAMVVSAAAIGVAVYQVKESDSLREELEQANGSVDEMKSRIVGLADRLSEAQSRIVEKDLELAKLEEAGRNRLAQSLSKGSGVEKELTRASVQARYKRAQEWDKSGRYEEALKEYLWCFDIGMPGVSGYGAVRTSYLLNKIASLGEKLPQALTELRKRRDAAEIEILTEELNGSEAISTLTRINRKLGVPERSLELYDSLEENDRNRRSLSIFLFDEFLEAKRYEDAAPADSYGMILSRFEHMKARDASSRFAPKQAEKIKKATRSNALKNAAEGIEALAGSGQIEEAVEFAARVMEFDQSVETINLLNKHLERAGRSDLLDILLDAVEGSRDL